MNDFDQGKTIVSHTGIDWFLCGDPVVKWHYFLFHGYDWLAFGYLAIAMAFIGPIGIQ